MNGLAFTANVVAIDVVAAKKNKLLSSLDGKIAQHNKAHAASTSSVAMPAPAICNRF